MLLRTYFEHSVGCMAQTLADYSRNECQHSVCRMIGCILLNSLG